jgi:hypothetical protein
VEAFVSNDGQHYTKVAEFFRWNKDEFKKFGITQVKARGNAVVDTLRFKNFNTQGRFVGLRIYGSTITVSDELTVLGSPAVGAAKQISGAPSDFSVTQPQVYFNKPYLEVATNIDLPVPIGLATPEAAGSDVTLKLDLPPGLKMTAGKIGGIDVTSVAPKVLLDGYKQYTFDAKSAKADKMFGQVYTQASGWKDGQKYFDFHARGSGVPPVSFLNSSGETPEPRIQLRHTTYCPFNNRVKLFLIVQEKYFYDEKTPSRFCSCSCFIACARGKCANRQTNCHPIQTRSAAHN